MNDDTTPIPPPPPSWRPYSGPPAPAQPTQPMPSMPPAPPNGPQRSRGRAAFAGGVLAGALVVGAGAGVGSAAAWTHWHGDNGPADSANSPVQNAQVVSAPKAQATNGSVEAVANKVLPSVVEIDVSGSQGAGSGSGIILSSDGRILTNNHVVELAKSGGTINVSFNNGEHTSASILGTDPLTDTALIQAKDVSGLTPATIGKSASLAVGQQVVAVGSPFGLASTVTSGIVSALDRPVDVGTQSDAPAGNSTTYPAIQTDAAINPGNSGGPLVDLNGDVVGIDASIRTADSSSSAQSGSIGLGFAIPIDEVLPIIDQMAAGQTPTHARLGVKVGSVSKTDDNGNPFLGGTPSPGAVVEGAKIAGVDNGSTAQGAGIKVGDIITKVDSDPIVSADSLVATIRSFRPGDKVTITYVRDGQTKTAELTLASDAGSSTS